MMMKPRINATLTANSVHYISKIARILGVSKSKALDVLLYASECEIDTDTIQYIYTNLYQWTDGRKGRKNAKK